MKFLGLTIERTKVAEGTLRLLNESLEKQIRENLRLREIEKKYIALTDRDEKGRFKK